VTRWTVETAAEAIWFVRSIRSSGDKRCRIVERSSGMKTKIAYTVADDEWYDPL
jgi:hypothetical protein